EFFESLIDCLTISKLHMVVLRDLRSMFWGVTIDGGKRYTQTVERSFHISMAALEAVPEGNSSSKHLSQVSVMINHDKAEFLLCTLNHKHLLQQTLDLNFTEGEEVTFFLNGQGVVHLTGYLLEDQMDESPDDYTLGTDEEEESIEEMSDEDEESDEAPELVNIKKKKLKQLELTPGSKRKATGNDTPTKKLKLEELNEFIDDEADEEESDEEEDEEDMVESKTPQGNNQSAKAQKKKKKQKQDNKDDEEQSKEIKTTPQNSLVAGGDANASAKKKKKKKKKKNKEQEDGNNQQTTAGTQQSPKPQQQTPKPQQQTPKPQQQTPKPQQQTPKPQQQQQKTPKKQVLAGGVLMEELKVGNGPDAKKGKMVHVYYVGRLSNGKEFDSCKSGKPFRFRLGKFEVIKGWEIGIEGMKVGGKRRLTVPPQQGYGSQKQGEIPPNSILVFDVELKAVS
ncbi:hypothetical protein ACJMK2_043079, partial [Sinanodonta woodiana]